MKVYNCVPAVLKTKRGQTETLLWVSIHGVNTSLLWLKADFFRGR